MKLSKQFTHFNQNKSILVFGYQGLNNIGDDLMFISGFHEFPKIFSVKRPYKILNEIHQNNFNFFIKLLIKDQLVFNGGNIFNVATNLSYVKLVFFMMLFFFRKLFNKKTVLNSAGFNFSSSDSIQQFMTLFCLKRATHIFVRDFNSYNFLIKNKFENISFRDDIVYYNRKFIIKKFPFKTKTENSILWFVSKQNNKAVFFKKLRKEIKTSTNIIFVLQDSTDLQKANDYILQNKLKEGTFKLIQYNYLNINIIMTLINKSKLIVTERYHGAVLAEIFSKKWIMAGDSEKLTNFMINTFKLK